MNAVVVAAFVFGGVIAALSWSRRRIRRLHSQDCAFAVCAAFGPELGLPREVRIRRAFPSIDAAVLSLWLEDFARLDGEIDRLARHGGPQRLGAKTVEEALRRGFPFLVGPGLRQAAFLVGYSAMHDGYDKSPHPA